MNLGLRTPGILKISPRGALTLWIPKSASWQQCLRTDSSILWIFRAMRILGVRGALPAFCGSVWLLEQVYSSELFSYPLMWDCRWVFSCVYPKIVFMWNLILLLDPFLPPWDGVCQSESESHSVVPHTHTAKTKIPYQYLFPWSFLIYAKVSYFLPCFLTFSSFFKSKSILPTFSMNRWP